MIRGSKPIRLYSLSPNLFQSSAKRYERYLVCQLQLTYFKRAFFTNAAVLMAPSIPKLRCRHLKTTVSHKPQEYVSNFFCPFNYFNKFERNGLSIILDLLLTVCIKYRHITMGRKFQRLLAFGMPTITIYFRNIHGHYFRASQQNTTFFPPVDHFIIADEQNF
jgi:hypothetical protein